MDAYRSGLGMANAQVHVKSLVWQNISLTDAFWRLLLAYSIRHALSGMGRQIGDDVGLYLCQFLSFKNSSKD